MSAHNLIDVKLPEPESLPSKSADAPKNLVLATIHLLQHQISRKRIKKFVTDETSHKQTDEACDSIANRFVGEGDFDFKHLSDRITLLGFFEAGMEFELSAELLVNCRQAAESLVAKIKAANERPEWNGSYEAVTRVQESVNRAVRKFLGEFQELSVSKQEKNLAAAGSIVLACLAILKELVDSEVIDDNLKEEPASFVDLTRTPIVVVDEDGLATAKFNPALLVKNIDVEQVEARYKAQEMFGQEILIEIDRHSNVPEFFRRRVTNYVRNLRDDIARLYLCDDLMSLIRNADR